MRIKETTKQHLNINSKFWINKKVLITGHTGFKGTWLTLLLSRMGADIKGFALRPATEPSIYDLIIREEDLDSTYGDIRNLDFLKNKIKSFNPEIIIHLAAQPIVRESYEDPIETFQTNVMGTVNVLEAARSIDNLRAVLCITSDKCYENRKWAWKYRENDMMGGHDPYSASKGCAELVISSYRKSFFNIESYNEHGVAVASARGGNVIGGGDWTPDRLVPDMMRSFHNGDPVVIRNPKAVRPWQHVLDVLRGYIMLMEKLYEDGPQFAEAWNFGPNAEGDRTVQELVEQITRFWGDGACWVQDKRYNPHEAFTLKLDISKARSDLNWKPMLTFNQSLELVVNWYKQFYSDGEDARLITEKQIRKYEDMSISDAEKAAL